MRVFDVSRMHGATDAETEERRVLPGVNKPKMALEKTRVSANSCSSFLRKNPVKLTEKFVVTSSTL